MSIETPLRAPKTFSHRLRSAAIILLVAALTIGALVLAGELAPRYGALALAAIGAAALVPWHLHQHAATAEQPTIDPVETETVRALIGGMTDPAVLLDRAGRVIHLNSAAAALVPAMRKGELAQFALRSPEILAALREALATASLRRVTYTSRGQVELWLELVISPIPVPTAFGGRSICMLMSFRDLTPLRRVEEMRADFIANASHELRTPLAALSGFIDTMRGSARDDAKARERFLEIMHAQAARMARLIDDLLSLSRVELAAHRAPTDLLDLKPVLRQVVDGLEPLARERGVTVTLEAPDEALTVTGDREELLRLFENLIENALKYGASGQRVDVVAREENTAVRVSVRDYGPGVAPEHLPRLTERFYRADVGDSRAQGGTGLGLALVKHILNRHRGKLGIESVLGQGATFSATFPPAPSPQDD
jgi:two-component system phosphate regulon sensor histidine kinase PhoR